MKTCVQAICFGLCFFSGLPLLADEAEVLQVFLQGPSSGQMSDLVEQAGGAVTHDLHIINAVGAKLTREQLDAVLTSPLVARHIDDLSPVERPEDNPDEEGNCRVRGHIELDMTAQGILWPLYNKKPKPAFLQRLELEWPVTRGPIAAMAVGDTVVDPALYSHATAGSLTLEFPASGRPVITDRADLKVSFQTPVSLRSVAAPRQRDFTINAEFTDDCKTDLVPGYDNNHGDFYYNTVAGIDALQLQGVTGKGVTVAVIDSGLWEHEALVKDTSGAKRLVARYDALTDTAGREVVDESGHGTHMTSIIANSDRTIRNGIPTGTYKGAAPDVALVAVKVLDEQGLAHVLEIVRAVQWVVDNREKYDIRVLNLSFSQRPRWPYWEDPVNQAVMRAWVEGIAVVAAAGNDGPAAETIGSPGNLPYVITVGAVTDSWTPDTRDDDYIPDFSARGPTPTGHIKPDVVALGGHMTGLIHPDSAIAREQPEDMLKTGEFVSTGSSQASALVSGMLALLIQLEPDLTPDDLKCKLITSAEPAINRDGRLAYSPFEQGYGYVTASRAVTLGERGCGNIDFVELRSLLESDLKSDLKSTEYLHGPAIIDDDGGPSLPGLSVLVSSKSSDKGMSRTRKWGVKDHIERLDANEADDELVDRAPVNWLNVYLKEKTVIESLSRNPPRPPGSTQ